MCVRVYAAVRKSVLKPVFFEVGLNCINHMGALAMRNVSDRMSADGHDARSYGCAAEPLPDLHVFSRLSEMDEAYAKQLAEARARQETIEREVMELAKRLMAPLEGVEAAIAEKGGRWFGRSISTSSTRGA